MARGFLDSDTFHSTRECEDCISPDWELPMSKALKWDADLCDKCVN